MFKRMIKALGKTALIVVGSTLLGCGSGAPGPSTSPPADLHETAAAGLESGAPVAGGACCVEAPSPGCADPDIETCVCAQLPECCTNSWTLECVGAAAACGGCPHFTEAEQAIAALLIDSDGDGLLDLDEIIAGLNPFWPYDGPDVDGDGIDNGDDPDVDGDGTFNAYDDDVDGDGIDNVLDDDIDGDGLLNRLDDDDDGDGIPDLIDNDDDADGFPERDDEANDDDDDDDDDDEEKCKKNKDCSGDKVCADGDCVTAAEAAKRGPVDETNCSADGDCEDDEVCLVALGDAGERPKTQCQKVDRECGPSDDEDGDGVCDKYDPDPDGNGDTDDDDDGLNDREERALGTDPNDWDSDDDFTGDGDDTDPLNDEIGGAEGVAEPDEDDDGDDEESDEGGEPETGEDDIEDGGGLPEEPDAGEDEGSSPEDDGSP